MSNHAGPPPLRHDAARARHDRHLSRGRQRQPSAAVGRREICSAPIRSRSRSRPARSRRSCSTWRRRSRPSARSRLKAQRGEEMPVGWMIDRDRQAAHRSQARRRRPAAADRRIQGLRLEPDHRASRRHAQSRRRSGSDVIDFVKDRGNADQHRPCHCRALDRSVRAGRSNSSARSMRRARHARRRTASRRGAHLAAGRAEPSQAHRPRRQRRPDAQAVARQPSTPWHAISASCRCRDLPRNQQPPACGREVSYTTASAFIGLGLLGEALARRLLDAGIRGHGFRPRSRQDGQRWRSSAVGLQIRSPTLPRSCRPDHAGGVQHRPGRGGGRARLLPGARRRLRPDRALCASTCDPDRIAALGERVSQRAASTAGDAGIRLQRSGEPR